MPHSSQVPEPWKSFLGELNLEATAETRLDCMGGFVATLLYGLPRATSDLDVLLIAPREQREPLLELGIRGGALHKKYQVFLEYVGVATVPEDYEERLTEMFRRSLERNIQRDRDDVKHLAQFVPLDLKILKERYEKETSLAARQSRT